MHKNSSMKVLVRMPRQRRAMQLWANVSAPKGVIEESKTCFLWEEHCASRKNTSFLKERSEFRYSFLILLNTAEFTPSHTAASLKPFSFLLRLCYSDCSRSSCSRIVFFPRYALINSLFTNSVLLANCCCRNMCCNRTDCTLCLLSPLLLLMCQAKTYLEVLFLFIIFSGVPSLQESLWVSSSLSDLYSRISSIVLASLTSSTSSPTHQHSLFHIIVYFSPKYLSSSDTFYITHSLADSYPGVRKLCESKD